MSIVGETDRAGDFAPGGHRLHGADRKADQRPRFGNGDSLTHMYVRL